MKSEVEMVLEEFEQARMAEYMPEGNRPVVCVAGWVSYAQLWQAIILRYNLDMVKLEDTGTIKRHAYFEFHGIKIYKSQSIERGFFMGGFDL